MPVIKKTKYDDLIKKFPTLIWREISSWATQSAIRNPRSNNSKIKLSAGQLIELVGMKWYRQWDVGVADNHALILLNYGNGTGQELVALADTIQKKVLEQFDVQLEPEVLYI